ncbi:cyclophilin-like fold protein [Modicisalibacter xianhensis]|uniref:Cyclophilin-like domain-containing protein n=1 Tax=Modicisalibacter xianhensis TaxID=442341 RepID=A0A1I3D5W4_9GAMM|nr:cyclophilin-like fold protein [Halomonas xianhensis]SFH82124.1 hypothetical protein SAMN04487959_11041 [Halomonas xianhensis]
MPRITSKRALGCSDAVKGASTTTLSGENHTMDIVFDVEGQQISALLDDTAAARAFADMLPLELSLDDFGAGVEKIADLPGSLPIGEAPSGMTPRAGDITYYAPWGNLAIFRQGFSYAKGLVKLGGFTADFTAIDHSGPIKVIIRPAK